MRRRLNMLLTGISINRPLLGIMCAIGSLLPQGCAEKIRGDRSFAECGALTLEVCRQENSSAWPECDWPSGKYDGLYLKCEGFCYMDEDTGVPRSKDMIVARALYVDDKDRYCFVCKIFRNDAGKWREVGCGELSLARQSSRYEIVGKMQSAGVKISMSELKPSARRGSGRDIDKIKVVVEYGLRRCSFYLLPLSEV